MIPVKHILLEKAFNVRDLGGILTEDGRVLRWNTLYRADGLAALTEQDWQRLYRLGVRTVLDLRSASENEVFTDRPPKEIQRIHCPMQAEELDVHHLEEGAAAAFQRSLTDCYTDMVLRTPKLLCHALSVLTDALQKGAVLFHCTAGKDRTGVLAASVLYLLGAGESDILADYEVSNTFNRLGVEQYFRAMPNAEALLPTLNSDPKNMLVLLDVLRSMDFAAHLDENGFSYAQQAALRERAAEPYCV